MSFCELTDWLRDWWWGVRILDVSDLLFYKPVHKVSGGLWGLLFKGYRGSYPEVQRAGRVSRHSSPFSAKVEKEWSLHSTTLYVFMAWERALPSIISIMKYMRPLHHCHTTGSVVSPLLMTYSVKCFLWYVPYDVYWSPISVLWVKPYSYDLIPCLILYLSTSTVNYNLFVPFLFSFFRDNIKQKMHEQLNIKQEIHD